MVAFYAASLDILEYNCLVTHEDDRSLFQIHCFRNEQSWLLDKDHRSTPTHRDKGHASGLGGHDLPLREVCSTRNASASWEKEIHSHLEGVPWSDI